MKQFAIALTCGLALALIAALLPMVIMQRQRNLVAQQNQQRIEARRLESEQPWALEQQRSMHAAWRSNSNNRRSSNGCFSTNSALRHAAWRSNANNWRWSNKRLDEAGRLEQR